MINLREFWQAAVANLRAIFSARPAPPSVTLARRPPMLALPGPVASDEWMARPPHQIDDAPTPNGEAHPDLPHADRSEPPIDEDSAPAAATPTPFETNEADKAVNDADDSTIDDSTIDDSTLDDLTLEIGTPAAADTDRSERAEPEPLDIAAQTHEPPANEERSAHNAAPSHPPQTHDPMPPVAAELEALLFVAAEPTAPTDLARALEHTPEEIDAALRQLADFYQQQGRGLRLQWFNDKVQLVTAPVAAPSIERFLDLDSTSRLSGPALETLAVIAYRQPVTRVQIESVRGVDCAGVLRSLLQRGLIAEVGRVEGPGRPILYGVTEHFMQHFGLTALDDLPPLEEDDADRLWAATLLAEEEAEAEQTDERD